MCTHTCAHTHLSTKHISRFPLQVKDSENYFLHKHDGSKFEIYYTRLLHHPEICCHPKSLMTWSGKLGLHWCSRSVSPAYNAVRPYLLRFSHIKVPSAEKLTSPSSIAMTLINSPDDSLTLSYVETEFCNQYNFTMQTTFDSSLSL